MMTLIEKVKRTLDKYDMVLSGDRVLVGVSGGPDSMALLHILLSIREELGITLKTAHLNHGFRPEATQEAEFVGRISDELGLEVFIGLKDVPSIRAEQGLSAQEAARNARYAFFEEALHETGANKVALAHTSDDQAETILMRLLRGAGPLGLAGIPPVRGTFIRPIIDCSRAEIEDYLSKKGIPYITDSSNLKMDYLRNRVRMELIPFLAAYNPKIKETLIRTSELVHADNHYLDMEAGKAFRACNVMISPEKDKVSGASAASKDIALELKALKNLDPALSSRVIRKAICAVKGDTKRVTFNHISDILNLLQSGEGIWSLHLPDVTVSRNHGKIIFRKARGRR